MPIDILMPALSPTMEEGTLSKWLVKEGQTVAPGDVIAEIETDKATMEVEAVDEGTIGKLVVSEGTEEVKVNTVIAVLLGEGESADDIGKAATPPAANEEPAPAKVEAEPAAKPVEENAAAPGAPAFVPAADPDVPEGTEMVEMTVRQALNRGHGRGNAQGRDGVGHGRGSRAVPGRLQGDAGSVAGIRR